MPTTYTLVKVEPYLGAGNHNSHNNEMIAGASRYRYTCIDNAGKTIVIESPDAALLTPGSAYLSGANTGTIVITDTPG